MSKSVRKAALGMAGLLAALATAAPAHAATVYHFRPAQPDPLVWLGVLSSGAVGNTIPTGDLTDRQEWALVRSGGTTFQPELDIHSFNQANTCMRWTPGSDRVSVGGLGPLCASWKFEDPVSGQVRAPGLVATGASGSHLLIVTENVRGDRFCLGFFGAPIVNGQVRALPCNGSLSQQWTLTRFTLT